MLCITEVVAIFVIERIERLNLLYHVGKKLVTKKSKFAIGADLELDMLHKHLYIIWTET
jgi:hypothetical protein